MYQPVNDDESKDVVTDIAVDVLKKRATSLISQSNLTKMKTWVGDGPVTFRVMCLICGIVMVIQGFLGFIGHFLTLSPLHAIIEIYTAIFGVVIIMLEGRGPIYPARLRALIVREAKFLTLLNGRGAFYFFVGTLLLSQWPDLIDSIVGLAMSTLGILMVVIGGHAKSKLDKLRNRISDRDSLRAEFNKYDSNHSGSLSVEELAELCTGLGSELDKNEIESALVTLDTSGNGQIEFEEFLGWWQGTSSTTV